MSKNQILAIVAATLLGAFWVYPSVERTQHYSRGPASVDVQPEPIARPIHRKQTQIKPVRVAKKAVSQSVKTVKRVQAVKRTRVNFERADRRPTSLPQKKAKKRDNLAASQTSRPLA